MSEYTTAREGFQRAMEWSLTGSPEDAKLYSESTVLPEFYHIMNDQRSAYDDYVKGIAEWRSKISDYIPNVHEFLRDGDQLAACMTGTIKVEETAMKFESFMFAKIDQESGKTKWLIERSIWGPVGAEPQYGVN